MLYLTRKQLNKEILCVVSERKDRLVVRAQELLIQIPGSARDFLCALGDSRSATLQTGGSTQTGERAFLERHLPIAAL